MKDPALKDKFVELRADGMSFLAIGKRLGVSKGTVVSWNRELRRDVTELTNARMETIKAKYKLTQSHQIERYGTWLKQIDGELSRRDFKDLRTDHLLALAIKITGELRLYVPPPKADADDSNALTTDEIEEMVRATREVVF